jgi:hypothetical protein
LSDVRQKVEPLHPHPPSCPTFTIYSDAKK